MFKFFKKDKVVNIDIDNSERLKKQDECLHKHFCIYEHNIIGEATCLDCGKTDKMYIFFNSLFNRLIELENRLADKLKK